MTPEFRKHELDIGSEFGNPLVCRKCVSNYLVAARNECGCREANAKAGLSADFERRIGERQVLTCAS